MLDQSFDYSHIIGRNILKGDGQKEQWSKPPRDEKGYRAYRGHYENVMKNVAAMGGVQEGESFIKMSAICDQRDPKTMMKVRRSTQKKEHMGSNMCFACDHVYYCDPVKSEDVWFIPFEGSQSQSFDGGYFLCNTCWKLLNKYKLDIYRDVCIKCALCVSEAVSRMMFKDPSKFHDLRFMKIGEKQTW